MDNSGYDDLNLEGGFKKSKLNLINAKSYQSIKFKNKIKKDIYNIKEKAIANININKEKSLMLNDLLKNQFSNRDYILNKSNNNFNSGDVNNSNIFKSKIL